MKSDLSQKTLGTRSDADAPLRLRTLGGVEIVRADGTPLGPPARQRRLLALMAVLAAHPQGISRDRVLLLLWPDREPEKARHALTQSLYHARRALECGDLLLTGADLRLNPARISSDIAALDAALAAQQWKSAAELYGGRFLDDFVLGGAGEFERWQSSQQDRIARAMARAFDELATDAARAGDAARLVDWRRRALQLDPLDSDAADALVRAIVAAGDRVGALREAIEHETRLREELGIEPDESFRQLVNDLRAGRVETPRRVPKAVAAPAPLESHAPARWWSPRLLSLAAAAVATAVVLLVGLSKTMRANGPELGQRILVAPFRVIGADSSLAFLREGMVELLSTRLGDQNAAQAVDAGAVIKAWRGAGMLGVADAERAELARAARKLGAQVIVLGSVVGSRQRIVVTASLMDAAAQRPGRTVRVEGNSDSLTAIIDDLAARLLVIDADEDERFVNRTTRSISALLAYMDGQSQYRRGEYLAAARLYERALAFDSTFALAAMQLALASDRINALEQHDRALALAWRFRAELSDRDRLHLMAFAGPRYPSPSSEAELLSAWENAAAAAPDRADTWIELGERFMKSGTLLRVENHQQRAARAFARALDLNPEDRIAQRYAALLSARAGKAGTMQAFLTQAVSRGDSDALKLAALASQYDSVGLSTGERALRRLLGRARHVNERLDALLGLHSLALIQGNAVQALDVTEQIEEIQPGSQAHLRLRVLDALYGSGDTSAAIDAAARLAESVAGRTDERGRALQLANLCVLGQWQIARGDLAGTKSAVSRLRNSGMPDIPVVVGANPYTCAELLDAAVVLRVSSEIGHRSLARLDSLMLSGPAAGDASAYAHIWMARMWSSIGEQGRALDAIRRRPYLSGWPRYQATTRRERARYEAAVAPSPAY